MAAALSDEPGEMNRSDLVQSPTQTDAQSTVADCQTMEIDLVPVTPKMSARYSTQDKFVHQINHFITPLLFCDPTSPYLGINGTLPDGWDKYIHPEGALYYVNHDHHIVTCSNVYDADVVAAIHEALKEIRRRMATALPEDCIVAQSREEGQDVAASTTDWHRGLPEYELVLELDDENPEEGKHRFKYYCADWERCCIFWLEQDPWEGPLLPSGAPQDGFSAKSLGIDAQVSYDQLQWTFKSEFWRNVEYFPSHRDVSQEWLPHLKSILKYATLDRMTSLASTVSAPVNELEQALARFPEAGDDRDFINVFLGRQFTQICFERSFNLYGTPHARLDRTQSRYFEPQPVRPQSVLEHVLHIFSFVFIFGEAGSFHRKLCETWVDKTVFIDQWRSLLRDVQKEWNSTGFMATVILAVNMGFLAINQLGGDNSDNSSKGGNDLPVLSQVFSVTSTLFSLGSIVSGMILRHQHRALDTDLCTAKEANIYMTAYADRGIGLYSAAVLFSMPFGMLLWSLLLFIAGVLSFSFVRFSHFISPFIAATTGIAVLVVATQIWYFHGLEPKRKGSTWKRPRNVDGDKVADPPPGRRQRLARVRTFAKRTLSRGCSFWSTSTIVESARSSSDLESGRGSPQGKGGLLRKMTTRSFTTQQRARDGSDATLQTEIPSPNTHVRVPPPARRSSERRPVFSGPWLSCLGGNQQQPEMMVESPTSMTQRTPLHLPLSPTTTSSTSVPLEAVIVTP